MLVDEPQRIELYRGMVAAGSAARAMGMTTHQLLDAAEKHGVDTDWGFHIGDLITLCAKLCAIERDGYRKAVLREALDVFRGWRDEEIAA